MNLTLFPHCYLTDQTPDNPISHGPGCRHPENVYCPTYINSHRFGAYATPDWQRIKAKEDYCLRHEIPYPHFNRLVGRPIKPSPHYERLKEKGAGELTNEVTLPEADVMRFVKLDKDFLGVEVTRASAEGELKWVCAYLEIEPDGIEDGHGGEAVLLAGDVVGSTASVAYGHAYGKILAFAYIKPHAARPGAELHVVIAGQTHTARVLGNAVYDPESKRQRMDG